jgi:hypothetical protein
MKRKLLSSIALLFAAAGTMAQINYEEGYYISNAGQKIACLIKNEAWGATPNQFQYKLKEDDTPQIRTIANTKEFGVPGVFKYQRYLVKIDRSSDNIQKMSQQEAPEFSEENLFLEVLLEGDATLYFYEEGNVKRYFYTVKGKMLSPEQLVYKRYKSYNTNSGVSVTRIQGIIFKNREYRRQLWDNLKCNNTSVSKIKDMDYNKRDMMKVFIAYNECQNASIVNYQSQKGEGTFNLRVSAGVNSSSASVDSNDPIGTFDKDVDFDNAISIRGGFEVEYVFAFNKNKWSVFAEPNYNYYSEEGSSSNQTSSLEYTSIEIPVGLRHYMFLNDKLKLFVNASLNFDFIMGDSELSYSRTPSQEIKTGTSVGFGLGVAVGPNFMIETRIHTPNGLFEKVGFTGDFNKASLIVRYKIF